MWGTIASIGASLLGSAMSKKGQQSGQEREFTAIDRAIDRSGRRRDALTEEAGTPFIERPQETLAEEVDAEGDVYEELQDILGETNWSEIAKSIKGQVSPAVMQAIQDDYIESFKEFNETIDEGSGELDADDYEDFDHRYFEDMFKKDQEDPLKFFQALSEYT
jgi:hypothetical protein